MVVFGEGMAAQAWRLIAMMLAKRATLPRETNGGATQ